MIIYISGCFYLKVGQAASLAKLQTPQPYVPFRTQITQPTTEANKIKKKQLFNKTRFYLICRRIEEINYFGVTGRSEEGVCLWMILTAKHGCGRRAMDGMEMAESTSMPPLTAIVEAFEELGKFLQSHSHNSQQKQQQTLRLDTFCQASTLVSILFSCLGLAFKFAEMEYVSKVPFFLPTPNSNPNSHFLYFSSTMHGHGGILRISMLFRIFVFSCGHTSILFVNWTYPVSVFMHYCSFSCIYLNF